jgi:hypothetical protein
LKYLALLFLLLSMLISCCPSTKKTQEVSIKSLIIQCKNDKNPMRSSDFTRCQRNLYHPRCPCGILKEKGISIND